MESQPYLERTRIPACNLLLPFATVSAGVTGTKILRIVDHMGLSSLSLNKFMKHQRVVRLKCHGKSHGLCGVIFTGLFSYSLVILVNNSNVFKIIISSVSSAYIKSVIHHLLKKIWEVLALAQVA